MRTLENTEFGRIVVRQIPFPKEVIPLLATYTYSGRVACQYRLAQDEPGFLRIMTLNEDGSGICHVFSGKPALNKRANGFRYMPFTDNKRVYTGDYILECEPDCDHAVSSRMVPVHYPDFITSDPMTWLIWSENVVSPDGKTIAWSTLGADGGVYVADLIREENEYQLDHVRCVSPNGVHADPDHPGCVVQNPVRGGEVKQFVRGGLGLTYVGMGRGPGNSMYQALDSEEVKELTRTPGYDETTMVSPDGKLGLVMSTRFSPRTSCAILGLIPRRGNYLVKSQLAMNVYLYAVAGAREFRSGANIGPALVDLLKSQDDSYQGVDLSDPNDEYVYYSPMSWHPSGKKVMWNEGQRRSLGSGRRVLTAELVDYVPGAFPEVRAVPQNIPYAVPKAPAPDPASLSYQKIAGKACGFAESRLTREGNLTRAVTVYTNFSDDGKTFLNGTEMSRTPGMTSTGETTYQASLTLSGAHTGGMDVTLLFCRDGKDSPVRLSSRSHGYAQYDAERIEVTDMAVDEPTPSSC